MKGCLFLAIGVVAMTAVGACSSQPVQMQSRPGIRCVDADDTQRMPVLFVHGMHGSPQNFRFFIESLDRSRFQPCVFLYTSSSSLHDVAGELSEAIAELHRQHGIRRLSIVAHSMGGLIARDLLLNRSAHDGVEIPVLITLSSPWGGFASAAFGARWSPVVPDSWRDVASGSAYLNSLFVDGQGESRKLPAGTRHYLVFSYRRSWPSFGVSSDEITSVASQLTPAAQSQATFVYGFDVTHSGVLHDTAVAALLGELLQDRAGGGRSAGRH